MDFSNFEYKRKYELEATSNYKKTKMYHDIEDLDLQHFNSPNILVFCPDSLVHLHHMNFIIADPSGDVIRSETCRHIKTFLIMLERAHQNGCVIVTYDLKSVHHAHLSFADKKYLNDSVFCILEESFIRTGLTKIDNKVKSSTCEDIYSLLHDIKPEDGISKCNLILKCFIGGRIKGWF